MKIDEIHQKIVSCRTCDSQGLPVTHAKSMNRGTGRAVMIIGIDPGNTEVNQGVAFSGASGRRLKGWLYRAGVASTEEELFRKCYFTSLAKCKIGAGAPRKKVFRNCSVHLYNQIEVISPKVVCTLGAEPFNSLFNENRPLSEIVGCSYSESDLSLDLFPIFPSSTIIVPLPHPSPLSRWLNEEEGGHLLEKSLECIRAGIA